MSEEISERFFTVEDVAKILKISPRTVQLLCNAGKIGSSKPGRRYLIPESSLKEYLKIRG